MFAFIYHNFQHKWTTHNISNFFSSTMCCVDCVKAHRNMVVNKKFDSKNRSQTYSFSNGITFAATMHRQALRSIAFQAKCKQYLPMVSFNKLKHDKCL